MDIPSLYQLYKQSSGVTTDTRNIQPGQLYFALKGASFDGNTFAAQSLQAGAAYAIIDNPSCKADERCIVVENVLDTLQQLGLHHRRKVNPKAVIAITGSNGKTTTKELVATVLATTYKTHYTKGNLNNHIGIPLTLLAMPEDTEIVVIEMGANHQQEIASYCRYVEPTHGIITNCGKAHLEGFGGVEGIRKGKGELYDYLSGHNGTVFVNGDDHILVEMIQQRGIQHFITYGKSPDNTYSASILKDNPFLEIAFEDQIIRTQLFGAYNYSNMLCAIAAGKYFNVANDAIHQAISGYTPSNARSQVVHKEGYDLIMDAYNANPTSMQHALESLAKSSSGQKVAILGDMFELGEYAGEEHKKIADLACQLGIDTIVLVGKYFSQVKVPEQVLQFESTDSAAAWFRNQSFTDALILLKGSRSMQMEKILP